MIIFKLVILIFVGIVAYKSCRKLHVSTRTYLLFRRIAALFLAPLIALPVATIMVMVFNVINNGFQTYNDETGIFPGLFLSGYVLSFLVLPISYFMMYVIFLPLMWLPYRSPPVSLSYCLILGAVTGSLHFFLLRFTPGLPEFFSTIGPWYSWVITGMVCGIFVSWTYHRVGNLSISLD